MYLQQISKHYQIRETGWHLAELWSSVALKKSLTEFCKKWEFLHTWWNSITYLLRLWSKRLNRSSHGEKTQREEFSDCKTEYKPKLFSFVSKASHIANYIRKKMASRLSKIIILLYSTLVKSYSKNWTHSSKGMQRTRNRKGLRAHDKEGKSQVKGQPESFLQALQGCKHNEVNFFLIEIGEKRDSSHSSWGQALQKGNEEIFLL